MSTALSGTRLVQAALLSSRRDAYALLAQCFSFPDEAFFSSVLSGECEESLFRALSGLPYELRLSDLDWSAPPSYDDMQSEYIRLFQIGGRRGPPCPLHEGHYTRDRSQTLLGLIRFYNFFGFRVVECVMPDHLSVELEFMSELAADGHDVASRLRAQRDFVQSHLAWVPDFSARSAASRAQPFYRSLTALTSRLLKADQRFLTEAVGAQNG